MDIIILAAIAFFIFIKLKGQLGKIDENDLLTLNGSTIAPAGLMSLGGGIPTPPIIIELTNSLNGEGQGEMTMERKYMSTSTGAIDTVLESGATTARGRQSWREIK